MGLQRRRDDVSDWERLTTACRPAVDRIETRQPARRVAATLSILGYPLLMTVLSIDDLLSPGPVVEITLTLAAALLWGGSFWLVYEFRRRLANAPDADLDERERAVRDRAYLQAHRLGSAGIFLVAIVLIVLELADVRVSLGTDTITNVVLSIGMALVSLPAAIVAWTEPDDDDLDPDAVEVDVATEVG